MGCGRKDDEESVDIRVIIQPEKLFEVLAPHAIEMENWFRTVRSNFERHHVPEHRRVSMEKVFVHPK